MKPEFIADLQRKGWVLGADGVMRKPTKHERSNPTVGAVVPTIGERGKKPTLVSKPPRGAKSEGRLAIIVTLISVRRRLLDDDNNQSGCKPLRDHISRTIGLDDGDPRIRFYYGQVRTDGQVGTIVKIERV